MTRSMCGNSGRCCCRRRGCSKIFRARFIGKVSPIHLFWGAMDLACTRFSGTAGAGASEHAGIAGSCDAGCVLARGEQCGVLARGAGCRGVLLQLCIPGAEGVSRVQGRADRRRGSTRILASSFCRMRRCESRRIRMQRCWSFCRVRMRLRRTWRGGTGRRWRRVRLSRG